MNHCCLWAEYAKAANPDGTRRWCPWQFVRDCFAHGVDYEIIYKYWTPPVYRTGPVGFPVGETPGASRLTASAGVPCNTTLA